jgi:mycothiol S-conjugate amidase
VTRRLMFIHAHPDDEASKGAATAARYVDNGDEVVLVTCTGGEAGEILNPNADPVPPGEMATVRAKELADAVAAIGFTRSYQLGYVDSGYHEDPDDVPEGTFARAPLDEPSALIAGLIRRERPHVIVTYPEDGGYPHPDHIMNHAVTMRGMELAEDADADLVDIPGGENPPWRVPKVYASAIFPSERVLTMHEALIERGLESPYERWLERRDQKAEEAVDDTPDARIECADWFARRDAALIAHVTQIDPDGGWFQVPRDLEREIYPYESYALLRTDVPFERTEDDLFAGLDIEGLDAAGGRVSSTAR